MSNDNGQIDASLNPTTKSDVASEIAWVIELPQVSRPGKPPTYYGYVEDGEGWTGEINEAIRFWTEDGANKYASDVGLSEHVVVEHAWVSAVTSQEHQP